MDIPFSPAERLNIGHEEVSFSGFWEITHVDDPSFVVVPPRREGAVS